MSCSFFLTSVAHLARFPGSCRGASHCMGFSLPVAWKSSIFSFLKFHSWKAMPMAGCLSWAFPIRFSPSWSLIAVILYPPSLWSALSVILLPLDSTKLIDKWMVAISKRSASHVWLLQWCNPCFNNVGVSLTIVFWKFNQLRSTWIVYANLMYLPTKKRNLAERNFSNIIYIHYTHCIVHASKT